MSQASAPAPAPDPSADASEAQQPDIVLNEQQQQRLEDLRKIRAVETRKPAMREELDLSDPLINGKHNFAGPQLSGNVTKYKSRRPPQENSASEAHWREWLLLARAAAGVEEPPPPPPKRRRAEAAVNDDGDGGGSPGDDSKASHQWNISMTARFMSICCDPGMLAARTRLAEGFTKEQLDANKSTPQNPLQAEYVVAFNDPDYEVLDVDVSELWPEIEDGLDYALEQDGGKCHPVNGISPYHCIVLTLCIAM